MVAAGVAITGAAWTTSLGDQLDEVWRRLGRGDDGLAPAPSSHPVRNPLVAGLPALGAEPGVRLRALAASTVARALADAGLDAGGAGATLVLGTALGALPDEGVSEPGAWAADVASRFPGLADLIAISSACSAGADAIGLGLELVRTGAAELCVCGGADVITAAKRYGHSALATMTSTRLRAFDRRHDGTLLGEGAGVVVLESVARAERRGARTARRMRGVGAANDAASMTSPDPEARGARLALQRALADAGVTPAAIGLVNAHGSGTPVNDALEVAALTATFAPPGPLVFATKGAFGHTLGATGALELIALMLALEHGEAPPIAGLDADSAEPGLRLAIGRTDHDATLGASLTLGFGGFDTCLVCEVVR